MPHGNAVAYSDGRKDDWCSAGHGNANFYRFHNFIQIHMAGNNIVLRAYNPYQGTLHFFPGITKGVKQGAVRCAFDAFGYCVASHHRTCLSLFGLLYNHILSCHTTFVKSKRTRMVLPRCQSPAWRGSYATP